MSLTWDKKYGWVEKKKVKTGPLGLSREELVGPFIRHDKDNQNAICFSVCSTEGRIVFPMLDPPLMDLQENAVVFRGLLSKDIYATIPYDNLYGIVAGAEPHGLFTWRDWAQASSLISVQNDMERVDEMLAETLLPLSDDKASKRSIFIALFCTYQGDYTVQYVLAGKNDGSVDYPAYIEVAHERIRNSRRRLEASEVNATRPAAHFASLGDSPNELLPSLTDVARWADAYGYLLVPKDGTQQG